MWDLPTAEWNLFVSTHETKGIFVVVQSLIRVQLFVTPLPVAHQASLSMGFFRQEYWGRLLFPSPGIFSIRGSNLSLLHWQVDFFFFFLTIQPTGKPKKSFRDQIMTSESIACFHWDSKTFWGISACNKLLDKIQGEHFQRLICLFSYLLWCINSLGLV